MLPIVCQGPLPTWQQIETRQEIDGSLDDPKQVKLELDNYFKERRRRYVAFLCENVWGKDK